MSWSRTSERLARFTAGLLLSLVTTGVLHGDEPVPSPSAESSVAPPASAVKIEKLSGRFFGDDPRFPFVLQVATRGDLTIVRGMGRMAYSTDDPTLIMVEFVGIGLVEDQAALRGMLILQPDGASLKEQRLIPWVGLYDSGRDDWQMMLSPEYVVGANRDGIVAQQADEPAANNEKSSSDCADGPAAANDDGINIDKLMSNVDKGLQLLQNSPNTVTQLLALDQMHTDAQAAAARAHAHLPPDVRARLAATRARLATQWNQLTIGVAGFGNRMIRAVTTTQFGTTGTGATPTGANDVAHLAGRSLDDVLTTFLGGNSDRFSYTLVPAPDAAHAWQVASVTRLPDGRIHIVNYGSAPDVPNGPQPNGPQSNGPQPNGPQGGTATGPGGSTPTAPPSSSGNTTPTGPNTGGTGSGSTGGTGTPPSGSGGTPSPDSTTRVINSDGSNRVPGSPPTNPPVGPDGAKPPQWAPAPPVPMIPPLTTGPSVTRTPSSRTGGPPLDPNITVLINEDDDGSATREQIDAARAALNRAGARDPSGVMTQAKGPKGTDGDHDHHDGPAAQAGQRGFQAGDLAQVDAAFGGVPENIVMDSRAISARQQNPVRTLMIASLEIEQIADMRQSQPQTQVPRQSDAIGVATIRGQISNENEFLLHEDVEYGGGSQGDHSQYYHSFVYRNFLIVYTRYEEGRIVPDIGSQWPTVLRNAQALIDRRFPPVKNETPAAAPASPGGAAQQTPPTTSPSLIRVPSVIGLTSDEAISRIKAAGLNVRSERGEMALRPEESETVYLQEPKGGQEAQPETIVLITAYRSFQRPAPVVEGKPARYSSLTGDWKCSCGETWSLQQQGKNIVGQESMDGRVRRLQGTFTGGQFRFAFQTTDGEHGQGVMVPDAELKRMNWRMTLSTGESWDGSVQRQ